MRPTTVSAKPSYVAVSTWRGVGRLSLASLSLERSAMRAHRPVRHEVAVAVAAARHPLVAWQREADAAELAVGLEGLRAAGVVRGARRRGVVVEVDRVAGTCITPSGAG